MKTFYFYQFLNLIFIIVPTRNLCRHFFPDHSPYEIFNTVDILHIYVLYVSVIY